MCVVKITCVSCVQVIRVARKELTTGKPLYGRTLFAPSLPLTSVAPISLQGRVMSSVLQTKFERNLLKDDPAR